MVALDQKEFFQEYPRTGPGTLAGDYLRRFWHPVCLSWELKDLPFPVRMLGEDLVAFRLPDGTTGLVASRCPHRCASTKSSRNAFVRIRRKRSSSRARPLARISGAGLSATQPGTLRFPGHPRRPRRPGLTPDRRT